jgi:hypothetical protein
MRSYNIFRQTMASVDRIEVRISADKRLARVVRAAVSSAARGAGVPAARASRLAGEAVKRFGLLAARGTVRGGTVDLTLEPAAGGLDVRIRSGARKGTVPKGTVLKVRKDLRRSSHRPSARRR